MRKPATLHYGDTLPSATEFEEGDMFYLRPAGELYIRSGGAWALSASGAMLTSVQNDGSGVELVSDTGTSHTAKVRTITSTGNGISPAVSSGGGEVELSFDKVAAGWGAANGFATLDGSTKVVERLSYEGVANGVATLTSSTEVAQPPSGQTLATLSSTDALAGEFFVAKSGVMYKAQGGYAGGPAILDSSGKIQDRLAYEGVASGVATLDASARLPTAQRPQGLFLGNTARDHKIVAGVIRNDGTGWALIGSPHEGINVDSVSATTTDIIIDYTSLGASIVHSFVATPDETMGSDGFVVVGGSVGTSQTYLRLLRLYRMSGYAYYDGASWKWLNVTTGPTGAAIVTAPTLSFNTTTGVLTISGGNFASWGAVTARNGPYLAQMDSSGPANISVVFRDIASGSIVTTPDTNMRVFVERFTYHQVDPTTYTSTTGNIWFMGIFS